MNIHRHQALRLALYLSRVHILPQLSGQSYRDDEATLSRQFQNLSFEIRREARRAGRRLIREANGLEAATCHLVPAPRSPLAKHAKWQRQCARYLNRMESWSTETPPCRNARYSVFSPKGPGRTANRQRISGSGRMISALRFMNARFNQVSGTWSIHLEGQPL
jgi:hypothetical protein